MNKGSGRVLFIFPSPAAGLVQEIEEGVAPSERLYGLMELRDRGWSVEVLDHRFRGRFRRQIRGLKERRINLLDPETIRMIGAGDTLVVKDDFSTLATYMAHRRGARIVFMDSMFTLPVKRWHRWESAWNARTADAVVAYSRSQVQLWARELTLPEALFTVIPYTIDLDFYRMGQRQRADPPYVLSVGRDLGRDFGTLLRALDGTGIELKLVTLPYLTEDLAPLPPWVEVMGRISYEELFSLYQGALAGVVPIHRGTSYPSGIRAVLESLALGVPTVASRTPVLEEYFHDQAGRAIELVEPGDPEALRSSLRGLVTSPDRAWEMGDAGQGVVQESYGMDTFVDRFEDLLRSLWKG